MGVRAAREIMNRMANPKDESAKGAPRPGDTAAGRRPHATLDLQATEVGQSAKAETKAESATGGESPKPASDEADSGPSFADRMRAAAAQAAALAPHFRPGPTLSHLGAGALGALIVVLAATLFQSFQTPQTPDPQRAIELRAVARRIADAEAVLGVRPGDTSGLVAKTEALSRSVRDLSEAQAQLASNTKTLEDKIGGAQGAPEDLVARVAKLEQAQSAQSAGTSGEAAKATAAELASIRTEAGRISQRLDSLKGEIDERLRGAARSTDIAPLQARLAAIDKDLQTISKSEADRSTNTTRVLLSLELAGLKRVMDRGEPFVVELGAVKKASSDKPDLKLNLAPLERHMRDGVPTLADLTKSFRKVSNAMLDSESEPADASIVDRLLSGARSIVRVRKAGPSADDTSLDATIARMDAALKEGRLAEVLEQGKKLPPKASLVAEDWLKQVEARQAVDQAMADIEGQLKSSLAGNRPAGEPTR
jgi:hypothetical protein